MVDLRAERVQAVAWRSVQVGVAGTMLVLCVGGFHYLATTNGMTEPGSLTYLGLVKWPLLITFVGLGVGLTIEGYDYVTQRLRERRTEASPISDVTEERLR